MCLFLCPCVQVLVRMGLACNYELEYLRAFLSCLFILVFKMRKKNCFVPRKVYTVTQTGGPGQNVCFGFG